MVGLQDRQVNTAVHRFPPPLVDHDSDREVSSIPPSVASIQHCLAQNVSLLACPRCGGRLEFARYGLQCKCCGSEYFSDSGIPSLFFPHDVLYGPRDVTQPVKDFYDANPFPTYDDLDSTETLCDQFSDSLLANLLNKQLSPDALILDAGCGTGRLANFLALQKNRRVIGADLSMNSLRHAKRFKDRCAIQNVGFLQMNLFRPPFCPRIFDVIIAESVLHHTSDPLRGFQVLASLLKSDGLFVLSLYNPFGRVGNDVRRIMHHLSQDRFAFLDRQRSRFIQRYKQPWETRHFLAEIATEWFPGNQFEFLYSSPRIGPKNFTGSDDLCFPRWPGDRTMQVKTEIGMLLRGIVNDGSFVMIGRNKAQPKQIDTPEFSQAAGA